MLFLLFAFFPRAASGLRKWAALYGGTLGSHIVECVAVLPSLHGHWGAKFRSFALHVAGCLIVICPACGSRVGTVEFFKDFFVGARDDRDLLAGFPLAQFVCWARRRIAVRPTRWWTLPNGAEGEGTRRAGRRGPLGVCSLSRRKVHEVVLAGRGGSSEETQKSLHCLATGDMFRTGIFCSTSAGVEMDALVAATAKVLEEQKLAHVLVTAPFYQLPIIKLCCQRAGLDVHTVPVPAKLRPHEFASLLVNEGAALWLCDPQLLLM